MFLKEKIIQELTLELLDNVDDNFRKTYQKQFRNGIEILGIHTPIVRKLANKYFHEKFNDLSKTEILEIAEFLIHRNAYEFKVIAIAWSNLLKKEFDKKDFSRFEFWLYKNIHHWSSCDNLSRSVISNFLIEFPEIKNEMISWTKLPNKWIRRAANISFIPLIRKKIFSEEMFLVAAESIFDDNYLVEKGAIYLIKESNKVFADETKNFIEKINKDINPNIFKEITKNL